MSNLSVKIIRQQSELRDRFYTDHNNIDVKEFIREDLHTQIKFLLKCIDSVRTI